MTESRPVLDGRQRRSVETPETDQNPTPSLTAPVPLLPLPVGQIAIVPHHDQLEVRDGSDSVAMAGMEIDNVHCEAPPGSPKGGAKRHRSPTSISTETESVGGQFRKIDTGILATGLLQLPTPSSTNPTLQMLRDVSARLDSLVENPPPQIANEPDP